MNRLGLTKHYPHWYNQIEPPIRDLVYHLRNNGINTAGSCGHDMTIGADIAPSGVLKDIHDLLFNYLAEHNLEITYQVTIRLDVINSIPFRCYADIRIGEEPLPQPIEDLPSVTVEGDTK